MKIEDLVLVPEVRQRGLEKNPAIVWIPRATPCPLLRAWPKTVYCLALSGPSVREYRNGSASDMKTVSRRRLLEGGAMGIQRFTLYRYR